MTLFPYDQPSRTKFSDPCPKGGRYSPALKTCESCEQGTYSKKNDCQPCPEGLTSPKGSTSVDQCTGWYIILVRFRPSYKKRIRC